MPFDQSPNADPVLQALLTGRERIADPKNWAQFPAYGINGRWCFGLSVRETDYWNLASFEAWHALSEEMPRSKNIGDYNDDPLTTHADVLAVLDRAIAKRRQ